MKKSLAERFWKKVTVKSPNECWNWTAYTDKKGYGEIKVDGKKKRAPRIAWELEYGTIPIDTCVCHKCDNPTCVNPTQLVVGTMADNMYDKKMKDRGRKPKCKHTDVVEITAYDDSHYVYQCLDCSHSFTGKPITEETYYEEKVVYNSSSEGVF